MVTQLVAIMHNSHNLIFPVTWEKVLMLMYSFPKEQTEMTHYQSSLFSQDIFQELEFTGVMRFYYQHLDGSTDQKVSTKCVRIQSTDNTARVIEMLIEKFR